MKSGRNGRSQMTQTDREVIKEVFKAFENVPPPNRMYIVMARSQGRSNLLRWIKKEWEIINGTKRYSRNDAE